jgi:hypothetical protein
MAAPSGWDELVRVALMFGTRDPAGEGDLAGLPGLALAGLSDADARALLASVLPGRLDERVRDRIIAESGGNPLALLELPRGVTAAELAALLDADKGGLPYRARPRRLCQQAALPTGHGDPDHAVHDPRRGGGGARLHAGHHR